MKICSKIIAGVALVSSAGLALAAEEYTDSVPVDLARIFIGNSPAANVRIYDGLTDTFPAVELPEHAEVLGTLEFDNHIRVIMRSNRNLGALSASLVGSLTDAGWQLIPRPEPPVPMRRGGFVDSGSANMSSTLCHDELGNITFNPMVQPGESLLQIFYARQMGMNPMNTCAMQIERMSGNFGMSRIMEMLPVLELTGEFINRGATLNSRGTGGSRDSYESTAVLNVDVPLDEVLEYFNRQIEAQGWEADMQNVGSVAASSFWTSAVEDDEEEGLIGMLTVIEAGDATFSLNFRITRLSPEGGFSTGAFNVIGTPPVTRLEDVVR